MLGAMSSRVLLIDDDARLSSMVGDYLRHAGFEVSTAGSLAAGRERLAAESFDALLLDLMLPDGDGLDLCRELRASPRTRGLPLLMLTARGEPLDRIVGLELGADDYVPKPFNPRELLARMRAVLRRAKPTSVAQVSAKIAIGPIEIDLGARTVARNGEEVSLTSYEFRILTELARRAGETIAREDLAQAVRDPAQRGKPGASYDPSVDRSLDVHVSRLRQKLEDDPKEPRFIKTVRGIGYVLARPS